MYEEKIKAIGKAKAIMPLDKEMTEKLNEMKFKVDPKRDVTFMKKSAVKVEDFFN